MSNRLKIFRDITDETNKNLVDQSGSDAELVLPFDSAARDLLSEMRGFPRLI